MLKKRILARIDVKNEFVVKGIQFDGLRKLGDPNEKAYSYYNQEIDEIIFMDAVAAYYDRNSLTDIIEKACENIFVPITVGGGIRTIENIHELLRVGADKVAINTQAIKDPDFLREASLTFGSQCIVSSIVAKQIDNNKWEVYIDNGREPTGIDVLQWAKKVQELGAGEILLSAVDKDGLKKGFDIKLNKAVNEVVTIPVISASGAGKKEHILELFKEAHTDAVALGSILHYNLENIEIIKEYCNNNEVLVR